MRIDRALVAGGLLLAVLGLSAACQTTGFFGEQLTVPPEKRITLEQEGPHSGTANTSDLTVSYEYRLVDPKTLQISGRISGLKWRADSVTVSVILADANGKVLERRLLYSSGYRPMPYELRTWSFDRRVELPANATAMAFSSLVQESYGHR